MKANFRNDLFRPRPRLYPKNRSFHPFSKDDLVEIPTSFDQAMSAVPKGQFYDSYSKRQMARIGWMITDKALKFNVFSGFNLPLDAVSTKRLKDLLSLIRASLLVNCQSVFAFLGAVKKGHSCSFCFKFQLIINWLRVNKY